ncbi:hypothetical protein BDAG_03606, partial [Burkholderia dolosa AU0158]
MQLLTFNVIAAQHAPTAVDVEIERVVIAGWAGRDPRAIRAHIDELAALGVAPPTTTPCFYRVAPALLTQAHSIDVLGTQSGGEIECVFVDSAAGTLVTLGSDHTDRAVEAYGVAVSKQMCAKPLGRDAWRYADVADHWDALEMRSWWAPRDGERIAFQHGAVERTARAGRAVAALRRPAHDAGALRDVRRHRRRARRDRDDARRRCVRDGIARSGVRAQPAASVCGRRAACRRV